MPHPDYLLQPVGPLSWDQFGDWMARYTLEPWGQMRDDARAQAFTLMGLAPYIEGDAEYPSPSWPYFEDKSAASSGWDAREALDRVKAYNARNADGN